MADGSFIDQVRIRVEGGVGGSGAEAFRREKGVPRGGPAGGDGGDGGSVILVADPQLSTLLDYRYRTQYQASRGLHGEGGNRTGKSGEDLILRVPPGTVVRDAESGEELGELLEEGERLVVARGGRGGRGNARFATATDQAPRRWEPGEEGEVRELELELKLLADVGLVGEPNAGKSTFLSAVTAARPKVAAYPFTTLTPNLGVVQLSDFRTFVLADLPGIIEGAHEGKGLGHRFLRHIERTRTLAFLIPVDDPDPAATYRRLREEIRSYSETLAERPHGLLFTKMDLLPEGEDIPDLVALVEEEGGWGVHAVSAVTGKGVKELLDELWRRMRDAPSQRVPGDDPSGEEGEEDWWGEEG